jgi:hypothetical protein
MRLKLGSWAAGGEGVPEGTVTWAGGKTDFSKSPFDMYVKEVSITNYNPAASYEYGDKTGSWQSIEIHKADGSSSNAGISGSSTSSLESTATSMTGSNATAPEPSSSSTTAADAANTYTSQASVQPLDQHTEAAVSVTQTGSMYSTNTASASALNSAINASTSMKTVISVTTQVPDSTPTDSISSYGYGNATETHNSTTHARPTTTGSIPAEQTANSGVTRKGGMTAASAVGLAIGIWLL